MIFSLKVKMQRLMLRNVILRSEIFKFAYVEMLRNRLNGHGCSVHLSLV